MVEEESMFDVEASNLWFESEGLPGNLRGAVVKIEGGFPSPGGRKLVFVTLPVELWACLQRREAYVFTGNVL